MKDFTFGFNSTLPLFALELPYMRLQDVERGIVLLDTPHSWKPHLALGCAWLVQPINIEALDDAQCLAIGRQHEALLRGLPVGTALQTLMTAFPSTVVPAWEEVRGQCTPSAVLDAQRAAITAGLPHSAGTTQARLREIQTLVTLRFPLADIDPTLLTMVKTLLSLPRSHGAACQAQLAACLMQVMAYFNGLRLSIEDTLRSVGHRVEALNGYALARCLSRAFDPMGTRPLPVVLPEQPLREQVLPLPLETERMPGGWRYGTTDAATGAFHEEYRCQVLSLHRVTQQTYPGMFSAPRAPGDTKPMALWDAWTHPMTIVINTAVAKQATEEQRLTLKSLVAGLQAKFSVKNAEIKKQVDALLTQQMLTGSQNGWARIHIVVWGHAETLARGVESVQRAAGRLKAQFSEEPTLGSTLFLQTLPLGMDPEFPTERSLSRARRMDLENLAHCFTLYGGTHGTKTTSILFLNQQGEAIGFHPFDNPTNPHFNIVGTSGAGKTYCLGHIVQQLMPLGAMGVILDPMKNYRGLCEYWNEDSDLIRLNPNDPVFINPFYGPLDNTHVDIIAAGLAEMASGGGDRLTWEEFSVLGGALNFFVNYWDKERGEPYLTHFVTEVLREGSFAEHDRHARRIGVTIARKLGLFCGANMYAGFVDGPNTFTLTKRLTLIEFGDLKSENLRGILFFFLFHLFMRRFEDPAFSLTFKFLFGDELWAPLKHRASGEQIERAIRTYRNYRVCAGFLSQRAADWDSPVGQVIKGIAATNLFLKQGPGELQEVKRLFELGDAEMALFSSVERHHGWNSFFLRLPEHHGGIARLVPDALLDQLMSQTDEMRARRAQGVGYG